MRRLIILLALIYSFVVFAQDDTAQVVVTDTFPVIADSSNSNLLPENTDNQLIIRKDISTSQIEDILNQGFIRDRNIQLKKIRALKKPGKPDTTFLKQLDLPYAPLYENNIIQSQAFYLNSDLNSLHYIYNPNIEIFKTSYHSSHYLNYLKQPGSSIHTRKSFLFRSKYDWFFPIILISIVLLATIKLFYSKYLNQIMVAIYNYRLSFSIFYEKTSLLQRTSFLLEFLFYINSALFLTQLLIFYSFDPLNISSVGYFFGFLIIVPLYYYLKSGIHLFAGRVFNISGIIREYISNINLVNRNLGIYLLPIVILYPYLNEMLLPFLVWTGIFIIIFTFLIKIWNGLQIILQKDISILYFILYLCTLEILPAFWIIKFIISFI